MKAMLTIVSIFLVSNAFAAPMNKIVSGDAPIVVTCTDQKGAVTTTTAKVLRVVAGQTVVVQGYTSGGEEILKMVGDSCVIQPNYISTPSASGAM